MKKRTTYARRRGRLMRPIDRRRGLDGSSAGTEARSPLACLCSSKSPRALSQPTDSHAPAPINISAKFSGQT
jgi:hypothetical protein